MSRNEKWNVLAVWLFAVESFAPFSVPCVLLKLRVRYAVQQQFQFLPCRKLHAESLSARVCVCVCIIFSFAAELAAKSGKISEISEESKRWIRRTRTVKWMGAFVQEKWKRCKVSLNSQHRKHHSDLSQRVKWKLREILLCIQHTIYGILQLQYFIFFVGRELISLFARNACSHRTHETRTYVTVMYVYRLSSIPYTRCAL